VPDTYYYYLQVESHPVKNTKLVKICYNIKNDDNLHLIVTKLLKFVNFAPQFLTQNCSHFHQVCNVCMMVVKNWFLFVQNLKNVVMFATHLLKIGSHSKIKF